MNAGAIPPANAALNQTALPPQAAGRVPVTGSLKLLRAVWLALVLLSISLLAASVPPYYVELQSLETYEPERASAIQAGLDSLGISNRQFAIFILTLVFTSVAGWMSVGFLIAWRKRLDRSALYFSLTLITFAAIWPNTLSLLEAQHSWLQIPAAAVSTLGFGLFFLLFLLFPTGRFVPNWTRYIAVVMMAELALHENLPGTIFDLETWPLPFSLMPLSFPVIMLYAQVYRYRMVSTPEQRQQTKLVMLALLIAITTFVTVGSTEGLAAVSEPGQGAALFALGSALAYHSTFLLVPAAIGIAILRLRLWEVDPIINRTLVYGALTICVVVTYVVIVGWLGMLFQARDNILFSLIATGIVAVLFQPLREQLQRGINRIMYGERDEPYTVVSRLGQRLEHTLAPETVLPTIVGTIAEALKLPYVAIEIEGDAGPAIAASSRTPVPDTERIPLHYQHESVGHLIVGARSPGEHFSAADRNLLEDLARQAGVAVHAVRLTRDLQLARETLVESREEERRRLRRDLHDGLGSQLAALNMQMGTLKALVASSAESDELIAEIRSELREAIASIRQIAHGLRPPVLDEHGLVNAIRTKAHQFTDDGLQIQVNAPPDLPQLSAATEVAIYRVVEEALSNVARHAQANTCSVTIESGRGICVTIRDDGQGLHSDRSTGVGLISMRERAAELGGTCDVSSLPGEGTVVVLRLPTTGG